MKAGNYLVVVEALSPEDHARIHIGRTKLTVMVANAIDAAGTTISSRRNSAPFSTLNLRRSNSCHCDSQNKSSKKSNNYSDLPLSCQASKLGFLFPTDLGTLITNPLHVAQWRSEQSNDEMCRDCNEVGQRLCASLVVHIMSQLSTLFDF